MWKNGVDKFGLQRHKCPSCSVRLTNRSLTPFHWLHHADEDIIMALILYNRYPLSAENVSEIMLFSGIQLTNVTVLNWTQRFEPYIGRIQKEYKVKFTKVCHMDEKFIGWKRKPSKKYKRGLKKWAYKITLLDSKGNIIKSFLAPERTTKSIEKVIRRSKGYRPKIVVTDGFNAYDKAVRKFGRKTKHVKSHFKGKWIIHEKKPYFLSNNRIERYHSEINPKLRTMRGVKNIDKADKAFQVQDFMHNFFVKKRIYRLLPKLGLELSWHGLAQLFYK